MRLLLPLFFLSCAGWLLEREVADDNDEDGLGLGVHQGEFNLSSRPISFTGKALSLIQTAVRPTRQPTSWKPAGVSSKVIAVQTSASSEPPPFPRPSSPAATELLGSNTASYINGFFFGVIGFVVIMTAGGLAVGKFLHFPKGPAGGCSCWLLALLLASYIVLIPGIFAMDFSFNIAIIVPVIETRIGVTMVHGGNTPGPIRESTRSLVMLLLDTGSVTGAILVGFYAFVVPVAKVVLLGLSELWRHSPIKTRVQTARLCVYTVQIISKWASPDMFAYILLFYLLRHLNNPPLVESLAVFETGFTCYTVFCIASTVSSLAIRLPEIKDSADERPPMLIRMFGRRGIIFLAPGIFVIWGCLFAFGITMDCLSLRLDPTALVEGNGVSGLPGLSTIIEATHLTDLVDSDVSLWRCMLDMLALLPKTSELNLILAFVMVSVFAVALPVVDMVLLLMVSFRQCDNSLGTVARKFPGLSVVFVTKHLAMLDVLAMGILVVSLAAGIYKAQGIILNLKPGLAVLVCSEVLHYISYYAVLSIADFGAGDGSTGSTSGMANPS